MSSTPPSLHPLSSSLSSSGDEDDEPVDVSQPRREREAAASRRDEGLLLLAQQTQESTAASSSTRMSSSPTSSGTETVVASPGSFLSPLTAGDEDDADADEQKLQAYKDSEFSAKNFYIAHERKLGVLFCMTLSVPHPMMQASLC